MAQKSPTDILREEHNKVLKVMDKLESSLNNENLSSIKENFAILEIEFDKHSLNKEEKVLFPEIEKFMPREGGPTGIMIAEHREIIALIKDFKENLKNKNFKGMKESGEKIFSILRPHIDKENNILFMMIDMHLSDEQKNSISLKFQKLDKLK